MIFSSNRERGGSHQIQGSPFGDLIPSVGGVSKYSCADEKTFRDTSFAAYHDVLVAYFLIFTRYLFYHINDDDDK